MRSKTERVILWDLLPILGRGIRVPCFDNKGVPKVDIIDDFGQCENINSKFIDKKRKNENKCKYHSKMDRAIVIKRRKK